MKNFIELLFKKIWWNNNTNIIFCKKLTDEFSYLSRGHVLFKVVGASDILWLVSQLTHLGNNAEKILKQQFNRKDFSIVGVPLNDRNKIIFSAWLSHNDFAFNFLNLVESVGNISLRRVWVSPDYRKKGIATNGVKFCKKVAFEEGFTKIWSFVQAENFPSISLHKRLDFVQFGMIKIFMRFGQRYATYYNVDNQRVVKKKIPIDISKL